MENKTQQGLSKQLPSIHIIFTRNTKQSYMKDNVSLKKEKKGIKATLRSNTKNKQITGQKQTRL